MRSPRWVLVARNRSSSPSPSKSPTPVIGSSVRPRSRTISGSPKDSSPARAAWTVTEVSKSSPASSVKRRSSRPSPSTSARKGTSVSPPLGGGQRLRVLPDPARAGDHADEVGRRRVGRGGEPHLVGAAVGVDIAQQEGSGLGPGLDGRPQGGAGRDEPDQRAGAVRRRPEAVGADLGCDVAAAVAVEVAAHQDRPGQVRASCRRALVIVPRRETSPARDAADQRQTRRCRRRRVAISAAGPTSGSEPPA